MGDDMNLMSDRAMNLILLKLQAEDEYFIEIKKGYNKEKHFIYTKYVLYRKTLVYPHKEQVHSEFGKAKFMIYLTGLI